MSVSFDEAEWCQRCDQTAAESSKRSGLSHCYYVTVFSNSVESAVAEFSETDRTSAIEIAEEWDYATPEELRAGQQWNAENGYCTHGIELGFCPPGCGSC